MKKNQKDPAIKIKELPEINGKIVCEPLARINKKSINIIGDLNDSEEVILKLFYESKVFPDE